MTHLLIIWNKGLSQKDRIVDDLKNQFDILDIYKFDWDKKYFGDNLKRFYAHSQYKRKQRKFNKIIKRKIKHCGDGSFIAIVFDDLNPNFELRKTSSGTRSVNANIFDRKSKYREWTGGGHKIHASDDEFETNKDLSLLFGLTTEKFKAQKHKKGAEETPYNKNVIGVPYWKSIHDLFFVFNNSLNYVVLRNFECLPDEYNVEGHGDIDLMVENLNYVKYLTGAKAGFPRKKYRCYYHININNEQVPFDFRYVADNYYDVKWQLDILNTRELAEGGFYKPDKTNYFYSLLYHALVQKPVFGNDYKLRLKGLSKDIEGLNITDDYSTVEYLNILSDYLEKKDYNYVKAIDKSVYFNPSLLCMNSYSESNYNLNKELVSIGTPKVDGKVIPTEVYKYTGTYLKRAFEPIGENEKNFLQSLQGSLYFPDVIKYIEKQDRSEIYIKEIGGFSFSEVNLNIAFWQKKNIKNLLISIIEILIILVENDILHRDIRPSNIILQKRNRKYHPVLIDFGWAINYTENNHVTPANLGNKFKYKEGEFSDVYSSGKCLKRKFKYFKYINHFVRKTSEIKPDFYENKSELINRLTQLKSDYETHKFSILDHISLFIKRIEVLVRILIKKIKFK